MRGSALFPYFGIPRNFCTSCRFSQKFAVNPDLMGLRDIGIPWRLDDYKIIHDSVVYVHGQTQIMPEVTLCSEISYTVDFERKPKGFFFREEESKRKDLFCDEQILVIDDDGLSVFLGCSHHGVVNCLNYVLTLFPGKRINLVVGGMHLKNKKPQRLQSTIHYFKSLNIQKIIPLHCTGLIEISEIKKQLGDRCLLLDAGDSFEL